MRLKCLGQQELAQNPSHSPQKPDFLSQIKSRSKTVLPIIDRFIEKQGLSEGQNTQLELLGFQDGITQRMLQKELWVNYAYQKGYITGSNRYWERKNASLTQE